MISLAPFMSKRTYISEKISESIPIFSKATNFLFSLREAFSDLSLSLTLSHLTQAVLGWNADSCPTAPKHL